MTTTQAKHYATQTEMPEQVAKRVETLAFEHGRVYDSYLVVEPGREYFLSPNQQGCVGFTRRGRYAHVVGGLLAPSDHRAELLEAFLRFARRERLHASFYNLLEEDRPLFQNLGMQVTKWGEDPVVDLEQSTWKGKAYEWLRRQENYCRRQQVEIEELDADPTSRDYREHLAPELRSVSESHLQATAHGRELKMLVSCFDPLQLQRRRLWIARREGRIEAFIVCNPCEGGRQWAVETYRRRADATRGVVPALMMSAMRCMQQEGVSGVSLCLIPCLRCDQPSDGDSRVVRRGLSFWWRYGNWLFDMRGIYHYKSRFRPEFRPLYVAASPRITFGSMRSCLRSWEVCRPKPAALLRNIGEWSRKLTERKSLAKPGQPVPTATPTVAASVKASKPVLQLNGNGKSTATIPTATGPTSVRPTVSLPPHDGKIMPDLGSVESVPFEGIWTIES